MEYKWVALTVTTVGGFMSTLDYTIVVIGLPTIIQDLQATIVHGIWIITGYTLISTILLVLLGRLADMYGRVKLYNLGFIVFTVGSLLCALSQTGEQLVAFRFLQGAGAALLMANNAAIIADAFPPGELGIALGINMMSWNLGAIMGYTVGGVMVSLFGWRSIFLINIPIGIFGTLWGYWRLKEVSTRSVHETFDYVGSILYCLSLSIVLCALAIGNPTSPRNLTILAGGVALFVAFIHVEKKQKYPTLDLNLFKLREFAAANITNFLNSAAFGSGPFLRSLYLQLILGYSALKAGVLLIPMEIIVLVLSPISGRLSDKYGGRVLSSLGLALNATGLLWFSRLDENSPYSAVLVSLVIFGLGRALFISPNVRSIMGSVPPERRGVANGIRTTLAQTGHVLSVPFSLLLMTLVMPYDRLSQIVSGKQLIGSNELTVFLQAINHACLILGIITALAIIPSLLRGKTETTGKSVDPAA